MAGKFKREAVKRGSDPGWWRTTDTASVISLPVGLSESIEYISAGNRRINIVSDRIGRYSFLDPVLEVPWSNLQEIVVSIFGGTRVQVSDETGTVTRKIEIVGVSRVSVYHYEHFDQFSWRLVFYFDFHQVSDDTHIVERLGWLNGRKIRNFGIPYEAEDLGGILRIDDFVRPYAVLVA